MSWFCNLCKSAICVTSFLEEVLEILADYTEFDQLHVRHNEDHQNEDLAKNCPLKDSNSRRSMESPNTKTFLLLQAHFSRLTLPFNFCDSDMFWTWILGAVYTCK